MDGDDLELGLLWQRINYRIETNYSFVGFHEPIPFWEPACPRDLIPSLFNPQMISIGPLHSTDKNLQASEGWKTSYLNKLMKRMSSQQEEILKVCVRKVHASLEQIKACYASIKSFHTPTFVEMIVVDACFILEFLCMISETYTKPYYGRSSLVQTILHDLMLLENQIPLFILNEMFQCTILAINPKASLVDLVLPILSCNNLFKQDIIIDNVSINNAPHILGLLHHCYKPRVGKAISQIPTFPSDVDLRKGLVTLKPHSYSTSYTSVHYTRSPIKVTVRIPVLRFDHHTEPLLWNLILYEKSYASHKHITSYVSAIGMLVKTEEDVAKMVDSGVLVNYLGSNGAVVSIFNTILKYNEKCKTSNMYCNGSEIRMRSTYFSNPWNIITLLAVIIMFAISMVQTIFTIKNAGNKNLILSEMRGLLVQIKEMYRKSSVKPLDYHKHTVSL